MKKISLLTLIMMLFIFTEASAQSCLSGYIYWTTQADIDSFPINNPNCTEIEGALYISGVDITNLEGLNAVTSIGGYLRILENPLLTDLSGLDNLASIGEDLSISQNLSLLSLSALNNLTSIEGNLGIYNNDLLNNLTGLNNVNNVGGGISISNNAGLTSLSGFDQLSAIPGGLSIRENPLIIDLSGLESINSVGALRIILNQSLTNISALYNLTTIGENVTTPTGGGLDIYSNNSLLSLSGLENVISIGGSLHINECELLTDLTGLDGLTSVGQNLFIGARYGGNNASLTSLTGLESLTEVGGIMQISGNAELRSFDGFENLEIVGQSLWIGKNVKLENIDALSKLTSVGSEIAIDSNLILTSLYGLENISSDSFCCLYIYSNPLLLECEVQSICDFLAGTPEYVYIINNAIGCNNEDEVEQACQSAGNDDLNAPTSISIFPNPAINQINIRSSILGPRSSVFIYDLFGRQLTALQIPAKQDLVNIDVSDYPVGIYVVEIVVDNLRIREKLIVH